MIASHTWNKALNVVPQSNAHVLSPCGDMILHMISLYDWMTRLQ
jgi:hypothetical protein